MPEVEKLSPREAAAHIGRSLPWFRRNWRAERVPAYRLGCRYVYDRRELDEWMKKNREH